MAEQSEQILRGVRVLDLSWGLIGSLATMLLSDYGAEVVKVERPGGSPARRAGAHRTWDRGKRSIELDLRDDADVATLRTLAATADVVIDGLGPGRADRLGIGYQHLATANPGIVMVAVTGDPDDTDVSGSDTLAAAHFGVMAESPGHREGPIFPGHPAHSYGTALLTAVGTLAALRARLVSGQGDHVTVSLRDGILSQLTMNWWNEKSVSYIQSKSRTGRLNLGRRRMMLERFECADGSLIQVHTGAAGAFARAMEAFGIADDVSRAEGLETATELTEADLEVLHTRLPEIIRGRTAAEWMEHLWSNEVACLPVQPPGQVFGDEQIVHAGLMVEIDDPDLGPIEVVGPPIAFSDTPGSVVAAAPVLDADGEDLRRRGWRSSGLGVPAVVTDESSLPLADVTILELANWFASPSGNRLLRDLGAEVIKLEPLQGDSIRPLPNPNEGANGGKRGVAMDLKSDATRPGLDALLSSVDVVQHNMRPGAAERLGIDDATVRLLNPDVLYVYSPGYGSSGPKSRLQSFAPLISGLVGIMHLAAGEGNTPHNAFGNEDYYGGLLSAVGTILGLIHRDRGGAGQYVEVPQLHACVLATSEHYRRDGVVHSVLPTLDQTQSGWDPFHGIYQCLDGWIAIACIDDEQRDAAAKVVLGDSAGDATADDLSSALTYEFFGRPVADWCHDLTHVGVPTTQVREDAYLQPFLLDDANIESGRAVEIQHPEHGRARVVGQLIRFAHRPWPGRRRAPRLGEHSRDVLEEVGLSGPEIEELVATGKVIEP